MLCQRMLHSVGSPRAVDRWAGGRSAQGSLTVCEPTLVPCARSRRYGNTHPKFFDGSYSMAVAYAQSACPASAHAQLCAKPSCDTLRWRSNQRWSTGRLRCDARKSDRLGRLRRLRRLHEFKFVVVYMHSQEHEDTDRFCRCAALHTRHSAVRLCFRTPYRVRRSACEPKETEHTVPPLIPFSFVCACEYRSAAMGCDAARCYARRTLPISLTTTISSGRARRAAPMGLV